MLDNVKCNQPTDFLITFKDTAKQQDIDRFIKIIESKGGHVLEAFKAFKIILARLPESLVSKTSRLLSIK